MRRLAILQNHLRFCFDQHLAVSKLEWLDSASKCGITLHCKCECRDRKSNEGINTWKAKHLHSNNHRIAHKYTRKFIHLYTYISVTPSYTSFTKLLCNQGNVTQKMPVKWDSFVYKSNKLCKDQLQTKTVDTQHYQLIISRIVLSICKTILSPIPERTQYPWIYIKRARTFHSFAHDFFFLSLL